MDEDRIVGRLAKAIAVELKRQARAARSIYRTDGDRVYCGGGIDCCALAQAILGETGTISAQGEIANDLRHLDGAKLLNALTRLRDEVDGLLLEAGYDIGAPRSGGNAARPRQANGSA